MKIYNSKLRKKENFEPLKKGKISIYVCGPTVYNRIHIGNARTFISFDVIRRYLIWKGYEVKFVQNITDVDDKIIARANQEKTTASAVAKKYTDLFIKDMRAVNVLDPDIRPKATEEIGPMIGLISKLVKNGHAYEKDGDIYFDVKSFKGYGSLSGRNIEESQSGHRNLRADGQGLEARKKNEMDFALWKSAKPGEPSWDSPWGKGRPGWHIECSAMSQKYLGLPFDIHGGGSDLIFPHHENERAQSICGYNCDFAKYWMHSGMLQIANEESGKNEKMSKSLDNFILLHEALELVKPEVLRMLVLQTHYRSPLVFGSKRIEEAKTALSRIENFIKDIIWKITNSTKTEILLDVKILENLNKKAKEEFIDAMDDDFNTSKALASIFNLISNVNNLIESKNISKNYSIKLQNTCELIIELLKCLGINFSSMYKKLLSKSENYNDLPCEIIQIAKKLCNYEGSNKNDAVKVLLECRSEARKNKNWDISDKIRNQLTNINLKIEDTAEGQRLSQIN